MGEAACRTGGKAGQDARCPPARRPGWPDASPGGAPCGLRPGSGFTGGREPFSGEGRAAAGRYPPAGRRCFARCCLPLRARSYCGRSSTRREMASATWAGAMASLPSRSAMVRARRSTRV